MHVPLLRTIVFLLGFLLPLASFRSRQYFMFETTTLPTFTISAITKVSKSVATDSNVLRFEISPPDQAISAAATIRATDDKAKIVEITQPDQTISAAKVTKATDDKAESLEIKLPDQAISAAATIRATDDNGESLEIIQPDQAISAASTTIATDDKANVLEITQPDQAIAAATATIAADDNAESLETTQTDQAISATSTTRVSDNNAESLEIAQPDQAISAAATATKESNDNAKSLEITLPYHSRVSIKPGSDIVSLMHIPKTGITTLHHSMIDLRKRRGKEFLNVTFAFSSPGMDEYCLQDLQRLQGGEYIGTLFRNPIQHIYSQYLECKFDEWGKETTEGTDFPREDENEQTGFMPAFEKWLRHFVEDVESHKNGTLGTESDDYKCYHPYNMQTRYLFCDSTLQTEWTPYKVGHHFDQIHQNHSTPREKIATAIRKLWFVGILEYYHLSVCLFKYQIKGKLPPSCRCQDDGKSTLVASRNARTRSKN